MGMPNYWKYSVEECRELLRRWREDNVRKSDEVVVIWETNLSKDVSALADEKWMILEQVAVAAMDVHNENLADKCLRAIREEFELDSIRVRRLHAMRFEMLGDMDSALKIYDAILEEDSANSQARKRKIAVYKASGENSKAIAELSKYLKEFMSDTEAWMELCDLYIGEADYAKAAFCCEEVLLHNANNHLYFQRYAEIKYTQGGVENLEIAKSYYSRAVALNADNMRALYGLLLTSIQLASAQKCPAQKKKEHCKTAVWTSKQISKRYQSCSEGPIHTNLLEGLLSQLSITGPQ